MSAGTSRQQQAVSSAAEASTAAGAAPAVTSTTGAPSGGTARQSNSTTSRQGGGAASSRVDALKDAFRRAIDDVERHGDSYLSCLEGALSNSPSNASQEYAALLDAILVVEKAFKIQKALHVSCNGVGKDATEVAQVAMRAKEAADADSQKTADAASVAAARFSASAASTTASALNSAEK